MRTIRKLNQAGDTIIEVMVVLAVLSMSFGISYATANKSLNGSLNAEEHSEALGILDTQLEDLRIAMATHPSGFPPPNPNGSAYFCMTGTDTFSNLSAAVPVSSLTDSQTNHYGEYGSSCTFSKYYYVSINEVNTATGTTDGSYTTPIATACGQSGTDPCKEASFTTMVRWDGVGGLGPQQESLTYRFSTDSLVVGYSLPEVYIPPVPILAILREIPLTGPSGTTTDPEPSCSAQATGGVSGATVTLTGPSYSSAQSTTGGDAEFNGLTDNNTYTATVTGLPSGYQLCQYGSASLTPANLGTATPTRTSPNPITIDSNAAGLSVRPVCTPQTITVITGWNPVYTNEITGWNPVYTNEITGWIANYTYYWSYIGTWDTTSNTTYIGVYAKYNNTTPGPSTLGWIAWQDPYKTDNNKWAWPMYQVDDTISSYSPVYSEVITGWNPVYTEVITGWSPIYGTQTIYNCP